MGIFSIVDVPAVADADDEHLKESVVNAAEDAVVIDPVAPELAEITLEAFAEPARVLAAGDALVEKGENPPRRLGAELAQLFQRLGGDLVVPAHRPSSRFASPGV